MTARPAVTRASRTGPRGWQGVGSLYQQLTARTASHHATARTDLTPADLLAVRALLAAGASPTDAMVQTTATALEPVRAALRTGRSLPDLAIALDSDQIADASVPVTPAAGALIRALAVAQVVGASAGPAVDGVLHGVGADARLRAMTTLRSAQAVMSARFLIGLPLIAATGLAALDSSVRSFLFSPIGIVVIVIAVVLIGIAAWWIRHLISAVIAAGGQADPLIATKRSGLDTVTVFSIAVGVGGTAVAGPAVGICAAVALRMFGGPLRRRVSAATGSSETPEAADGGDGVSVTPLITTDRPEALLTVQALELLAVALSAGVGLIEAVKVTASLAPPEIRPVLRRIAAGLDAGLPPVQAFPAQLGEIAALIDISHRWGAPIAQSLRLLAADLRDRAAIAAEEAAERLTVRLVFPTTMLLVPAFGLLVVTPMMASILSDVRLGL